MSPEPAVHANREIDTKAANTIRFLAVDAINKSNSGHPGMPMGMADVAHVLWTRHLRDNPADPAWPGRDRFLLSAGHGSMLQYALLHLAGYDLPIEELQRFRQLHSRTPGHPEHGMTPGVETTTGPLGQGIGNAVGMALASKMAQARFAAPELNPSDWNVYAIAETNRLGMVAYASGADGHVRYAVIVDLMSRRASMLVYDKSGVSGDQRIAEATATALAIHRTARLPSRCRRGP